MQAIVPLAHAPAVRGGCTAITTVRHLATQTQSARMYRVAANSNSPVTVGCAWMSGSVVLAVPCHIQTLRLSAALPRANSLPSQPTKVTMALGQRPLQLKNQTNTWLISSSWPCVTVDISRHLRTSTKWQSGPHQAHRSVHLCRFPLATVQGDCLQLIMRVCIGVSVLQAVLTL